MESAARPRSLSLRQRGYRIVQGHKFKVGQSVRLSAPAITRVAGTYRVVALLPEERGDYQYRIRSTNGPQQRVALESQLSAVVLP
jgi:hypothetical protein